MTDSKKPTRVFTLFKDDLKATLWRLPTSEGTDYYGNLYRLSSGKPRRWKRDTGLAEDMSPAAVQLRKELTLMAETHEALSRET